MTDRATFAHVLEEGTAPGPALLLLHGTGGSEHDLLPLGRALRPGAPLLSPRGQVLERGQPRFFRRLAEGVFDLDDLHARTAELAAFVRDWRAAPPLAGRPLVAVGFSNGANIAASLLLAGTGVLDGAVLLRAMVPFTPAQAADLAGIPVLLLEGRHDPIVPAAQAEGLARLLGEAGAAVTLAWQPTGHGLGQEDVGAARRWLAEHWG